jgi:excisionase family DNA binding protein
LTSGDVPDAPVLYRQIERDPTMSSRPAKPVHRETLKSNDGPRLRSVVQACHELGVSRSLLYELMASGALHSVKVRRRRLIPAESINAFVAELSGDGRR